MLGGGSHKEKMMGSTVRDLGNTIKEAKNFLLSKKGAALFEEGEEDGCLESERSGLLGDDVLLHHMSACVENADEEDLQTTTREKEEEVETGLDGQILNYQDEGGSYVVQGENTDDDVIDIDNPDDLAAKGLKRIQIDGEEEEYLMDLEGNIYDLQGNFIGTTDGEEQQMVHQEMAEEGEGLQLEPDEEDDY